MDKHLTKVHVQGDINDSSPVSKVIAQAIAEEGTERDWRNSINVPRPLMWEEKPELIGQTVIPHTCNGNVHEPDNEGCICELLGKPVKIVGIYETSFVGTPSYHIEGSNKRVQEREFSNKTLGVDPDRISGFIFENEEGRFLSAAFVWIVKENPSDGYIHNTQVAKDLLNADFPSGKPVKVYPASSRYDGSEKKLDDPIPFKQFELED